MEQQFQLKHHGNLSLFEQANMVAEDRAWWVRRLEREFKERQERESSQASSAPRMPSMPRVSRR